MQQIVAELEERTNQTMKVMGFVMALARRKLKENWDAVGKSPQGELMMSLEIGGYYQLEVER